MSAVVSSTSVIPVNGSAIEAGAGEDPSVHGLDADRIIDDLFITPKVIDRRGFEELSSTLRQLVRDATSKGESLKSTAVEVRTLGDNLREVTKQLQTRLEAALKVAPALDQRVAKAEHIVQLALDRSTLTDQLEKSIQQIIESRLGEYSRRLEDLGVRQEETVRLSVQRAIDDIEARRERLNTEATETRALAESARSRLVGELETFQQMIRTQVDSAAERLCEPVRSADRKAGELSARVNNELEAAEERLRSAREQADVKLAGLVETISRHAETVMRRSQDDVGAVDLRLRDLVDQSSHRIESLRTQADRQVTEIGTRIEKELSSVDAAIHAKHVAAAEKLRQMTEHAATQTREVEQLADGQIRELLDRHSERAEEIHATARTRADELTARLESQLRSAEDQIRVQGDKAEEHAKAINERAEEVHATARTRADELAARLESQLRGAEDQARVQADKAEEHGRTIVERATQDLDKLVNRSQQEAGAIEGLIRGSLESAQARTETIRAATEQQAEGFASRVAHELRIAEQGLSMQQERATVRLNELLERSQGLMRDFEAASDLKLKGMVDGYAGRIDELGASIDARGTAATLRMDAHLRTGQDSIKAQCQRSSEELNRTAQRACEEVDIVLSRAREEIVKVDQKLKDAVTNVDVRAGELTAKFEASSVALGRSASEMEATSASLKTAHAATLEATLSAVMTQAQSEVENKTQEVAVATEAAVETIKTAADRASDDAARSGADIAAKLIDLGRSTLIAIQEMQSTYRDQSEQQLKDLQQRAADIESRLVPARRLLESLPGVIEQQLSVFQGKLTEMISPTTQKLGELCDAASSISTKNGTRS
jgi:hypothetical protein